MIEWTISLGNILTIIVVVGGCLSAFFAVHSDVKVSASRSVPYPTIFMPRATC
jgi:hypothetical protein